MTDASTTPGNLFSLFCRRRGVRFTRRGSAAQTIVYRLLLRRAFFCRWRPSYLNASIAKFRCAAQVAGPRRRVNVLNPFAIMLVNQGRQAMAETFQV